MTIFRRLNTVPATVRRRRSRSIDPFRDNMSILFRDVQQIKPIFDSDLKLKRVFDIIISVIALVILSPLLAIAAILIKLESRGPVFYSQERIGLNRRAVDRRRRDAEIKFEKRSKKDRRAENCYGKPFKMYKLRTMRQDAEISGPALAKKNDSRITRIGKILRRTRIDELPQFVNVLQGDMSLIGPRPERSFYIKSIRKELPEFTLRLKTKPGITGLAQVEAGYANTMDLMEKKLSYDLLYIMSLSFLTEAKIIIKTISVILTGKGAY
ncbi:MAG: sugar transferase [Candidatus Krumholzibacteriota bacterium]|nr:sugar transferase [Candidatus Krumholzibacteriota bacterium]